MLDYQNLGEGDFAQVLDKVVARLAEYGIGVQKSAVLPPGVVAQFTGPEIRVAQRCAPDVMLFTLLHIFGHTVQYCVSSANELEDDASLAAHRANEYGASQYGLALFHELGEHRLDQWVSDIWHWDWQYMEGIRAGNQVVQPTFRFDYAEIPTGRPLLAAKPLPEFSLRRFSLKTVI